MMVVHKVTWRSSRQFLRHNFLFEAMICEVGEMDVFKEKTHEVEIEMEIGLPTDVKHVTRRGFDGPLTPTNNGCTHLSVSEFPSLSPNSMARCDERIMSTNGCNSW